MPTTIIREGVSRLKILSFVCAVLPVSACNPAIQSNLQDEMQASKFDGTWRGKFRSITPVGTNGAPCVDAEAFAVVKNGRMRGTGETVYGTYEAFGTISEDGSFVGNGEINGQATGSFTGTAISLDLMRGEFKDIHLCSGTWEMKRV